MSDEETVKIVVGMAVDYVSDSDREDEIDTGYTRAQWDALDEKVRDEAMWTHVDEHVADHISSWWREAE